MVALRGGAGAGAGVGDQLLEFAQGLVDGVEIGVAAGGEQLLAVRDHGGEYLLEQGLAAVGQAHEERAFVVAAALARDQALLFEPFDDAGQGALGDQGALAQLLVGHPGRIAQGGDDVELGMREAALAHRLARKALEALHALRQQADTA